MAEINPLRYRGYYYDTETKLYYLQSRYYDPAVKRFINADGYASTGQDFIGYNMYAYCDNNPVCFADPSGDYTRGQLHDIALFCFKKQRSTLSMTETRIYYNKEDARSEFGQCDLYDFTTGEVWELKRASNAWTCSTKYASKQLERYTNGRLKKYPKLELSVGNTPFNSGEVTVSDWTGTYEITYWEEGNGILRYDYVYTKSKECERVQSVIGVIAAGIIIYGSVGAAGIAGVAGGSIAALQ